MKKLKMYRQGDVLIEEIKSIPSNVKKKSDNIVAVGESQNHAHAVFGDAEILEGGEEMYLSVNEESELKHILLSNGIATEAWTKEHEPIPLKKGNYKITIQRQYNPYLKAIEQVKD